MLHLQHFSESDHMQNVNIRLPELNNIHKPREMLFFFVSYSYYLDHTPVLDGDFEDEINHSLESILNESFQNLKAETEAEVSRN